MAWSWIWSACTMFGLDWPSGLGLCVKCEGHEVNRPERSDVRFRGRVRPSSDWSNCGYQTLPANWGAAWLGRRPLRSRNEDTWALVDRSLHRRTGMRPQVHRPVPVVYWQNLSTCQVYASMVLSEKLRIFMSSAIRWMNGFMRRWCGIMGRVPIEEEAAGQGKRVSD